MIVNIDGGFLEPGEARLPVDDGGFLYGETLFETLKARERKLLLVNEHLDRLELSARLLDFPCDRKRIESALERTLPRLTAPVSRIRLTLTRGSFEGLDYPPTKAARFVILTFPYEEPGNPERETGAACVFAPNRRVNPLSHLPQMKRGNYADCLYAANHARQKGAREALFLSAQDEVLEGATSNLFIVHDGELLTPPAGELVLAGIMRRQVLAAAHKMGLAVRETPIRRDELLRAEEVFLSNCLIDILPVTRIENQPVGGGGLWRSLLAEISGKTPAGKTPA
ncbi:aminotransferase class IV [Geoalkalibacter sp.]|uniref:aminotransferase class IV n=1 Tax=Geoalkalibacter sp. TaxID=3041440 RepID=UPI00272DC7CC|nr:aminotransferase class IV [Geoalkalibacter sp.]